MVLAQYRDWTLDFDWQRKLIPQMKRIVGEYLVTEAPEEEDRKRGTDLIVLRLAAIRVACRARRPSYRRDYSGQITIRTARPSGAETELAKILMGWGDYFLYGFADEQEAALAEWYLCDLRVFRLWFQRECVRLPAGVMPGIAQDNHDDSSSFRAFRLVDLPPDFVVARSSDLDELPF